MTTTHDMSTATGDQVAAIALPGTHEHGWSVESRHATSQGWVLYVRCAVCGSRRVDLVAAVGAIPEPYSTVVANRSRV